MKIVHQCISGYTGSDLLVSVNFEKFILKIEWKPLEDDTLPEGFEGVHKYSSLEELFQAYTEIAEVLFGDDHDYNFKDFDNDHEEAIDIKKWYKQNWEPIDLSDLSKDEITAMRIFKKILLKLNENIFLKNLVFYWNDEACDAVYINNRGVNNKSLAELKKHIKNPKKSWLKGEIVDVRSVQAEDIVNDLNLELADLQKKVDAYMYKICAILEAHRCFHLAETAKDFKAFNIWHENEHTVNFTLRKKSADKLKKK